MFRYKKIVTRSVDRRLTLKWYVEREFTFLLKSLRKMMTMKTAGARKTKMPLCLKHIATKKKSNEVKRYALFELVSE